MSVNGRGLLELRRNQKSKYSVGRNNRVGVANAIQGDEKSTTRTKLGIGNGREVVLNT